MVILNAHIGNMRRLLPDFVFSGVIRLLCPRCNSALDAETGLCPRCGCAPAGNPSQGYEDISLTAKKKKGGSHAALIALAAVLLAVSGIAVYFLSGMGKVPQADVITTAAALGETTADESSLSAQSGVTSAPAAERTPQEYDVAVKAYCDTIESCNFDLLYSACADAVYNGMKNNPGIDYSTVVEGLNSQYRQSYLADYGSDYTVDYSVSNERALSQAELNALKARYADIGYDLGSSAVEQGYKLDVVFTVRGAGKKTSEALKDYTVIKVNGKWCVDIVYLIEAAGSGV